MFILRGLAVHSCLTVDFNRLSSVGHERWRLAWGFSDSAFASGFERGLQPVRARFRSEGYGEPRGEMGRGPKRRRQNGLESCLRNIGEVSTEFTHPQFLNMWKTERDVEDEGAPSAAVL